MMKFLILLGLAVVVVWWLRGLRRPSVPPTAPTPPVPPASSAQPEGVEHEAMVRCAECGLHLPGSEALPGRGGVFCSEAHRSAHEKRQAGG